MFYHEKKEDKWQDVFHFVMDNRSYNSQHSFDNHKYEAKTKEPYHSETKCVRE